MFRIRILVNGKPIRVYNDEQGNKWVESRKSTKFSLKIENDSWGRVLAIPSIDGLNTINAKHEDPWEASGYIINGNDSITIPGWLIDSEKVREFKFTDKEKSYAKKIGASEENLGVVGVAIFDEKISYTYATTINGSGTNISYLNPNDWNVTTPCYNPGSYSVSNDPSQITFCNFSAEIPTKGVAVGSGVKTDFATQDTPFVKNLLVATLIIYYAERDELIQKGVILDKRLPQPFPQNSGYCPDIKT